MAGELQIRLNRELQIAFGFPFGRRFSIPFGQRPLVRLNKTLLHETLSVPAVLDGLYQIEMGFGEIASRLFAFVIEGTQMDF